MPYKVSTDKHFEKDYQGFAKNKQLQEKISRKIDDVIANPDNAKHYGNDMPGVYGYRIFHMRTEYRLVYLRYPCCCQLPTPPEVCPMDEPDVENEVSKDECKGGITFIHVGTREEMDFMYNKRKKKGYFDGLKVPGMVLGK